MPTKAELTQTIKNMLDLDNWLYWSHELVACRYCNVSFDDYNDPDEHEKYYECRPSLVDFPHDENCPALAAWLLVKDK